MSEKEQPRCDNHLDMTKWVVAPDPRRTGWFRTTCSVCGGFVGYHTDYKRIKKLVKESDE